MTSSNIQFQGVQTKSAEAVIIPMTLVPTRGARKKTAVRKPKQKNQGRIFPASGQCAIASRTDVEQDEFDTEEAERILSDPNVRIRPFKKSSR